MSSNYTIYTGVWREHGSNKLLLTLNGTAAGALQAAIPLWISLVGPVTWVVIQYVWFHCSVRKTARNQSSFPFYHRQKQVLLRNSSGYLGTVADSISLIKTWWRQQFWYACWRTGPLFLTAMLFWCMWQVAAIVSFYIWQKTPPPLGLIRGGLCGNIVLQGPGAETAYRRSGLIETIQAETYVSQCYGSGSSGACNVYANQSLSYTKSNTTCPFATPSICITENSSPYQLDSGLIDSNVGLGINAPPENRITYQKIYTCSPIHSTKFVQIVNANETEEAYYWPPDTRLQRFYYGPLQYTNFSYTFEYSEWTPLDAFPYDIQGIMFNPGPSGTVGAWVINTTLTGRTDADISILFLTPNAIAYNTSVADPFFLTNGSFQLVLGSAEYTLYVPAYYVNVMGCIEQHRFCNPTIPDLCTDYTAYLNLQGIPGPLTNLNYNPTQLATALRILGGLDMSLTFNSVNNRRGAALLASRMVSDLLQTASLPIDQWRIEVENWFAISLAKLQEETLDFVAGPLDPDIVPFVHYPTDSDTAALCYNQLVQLPPGYTNFDFEAILIITLVGIFFIILGLTFKWVARVVIRKWDRGRGVQEWLEDGQFYLLKKTYATNNSLNWEHEDDSFPITRDRNLHAAGVQANNGGSRSQSPNGRAALAHESSHLLDPLNGRSVSPGEGYPADGNALPLRNITNAGSVAGT